MVKNLSWIVLFALVLCSIARRSLLPKIEISMLVDELSSQEAKEFLKRNGNTTINVSKSLTKSEGESDDVTNSTSSGPEDFEEATTDLISSVAKEEPSSDPDDYDATVTTTINPDDFNEPEAVTSPARPMLLSEFANHLASGIRTRPETTTQPLPDFPTPKPTVFTALPDENFPFMITAAKEFIRRYLSPEQWRKLRILLKTIKEVGGSRQDIHRAATSFISKVISKAEMAEITERKNELFQTFNRRYFDTIRVN
ncbi:unnamed protein product [Caenorhabditis sp. 36 PRJEB53466]|nr:unnamed protein product [Caenorhabditis sp. 36 PRJEB53466]